MSTFQEGNIECPFYLAQDNHSIFCEGYIKEVRRNRFTFTKPDLKKKYIGKYCCVDGGRKCMHNKIMNNLYDTGVLK